MERPDEALRVIARATDRGQLHFMNRISGRPGLALSFLATAAMLSSCGGQDAAEHTESAELAERQAEVAEAGRQVMPFDLDRTTHLFEKTDDGGVQTVRSDDGDETQIRLVREHLLEESERFARGDSHDPEVIHGPEMAGLHELVMGHGRIAITYEDAENGATIRYRSDEASAEVIAAAPNPNASHAS